MKKKDEMQRTSRFNLSIIILIVGFALTLFGFVFVLFLPFYTMLLTPAFTCAAVGILLLTSFGVYYVFKSSSESNKRIGEAKKKGGMSRITIFDAARMGKGMPKWWRWWHALFLFVILVVIVSSLFVVTPLLSFIMFFGYSGAWSFISLLAAKRWVDRNGISR